MFAFILAKKVSGKEEDAEKMARIEADLSQRTEILERLEASLSESNLPDNQGQIDVNRL